MFARTSSAKESPTRESIGRARATDLRPTQVRATDVRAQSSRGRRPLALSTVRVVAPLQLGHLLRRPLASGPSDDCLARALTTADGARRDLCSSVVCSSAQTGGLWAAALWGVIGAGGHSSGAARSRFAAANCPPSCTPAWDEPEQIERLQLERAQSGRCDECPMAARTSVAIYLRARVARRLGGRNAASSSDRQGPAQKTGIFILGRNRKIVHKILEKIVYKIV